MHKLIWPSYTEVCLPQMVFLVIWIRKIISILNYMMEIFFSHTCNVPPPPVLSQSSETLTIVHGSYAFQWKSTTLSLHSSTNFIKFNKKICNSKKKFQQIFLNEKRKLAKPKSILEDQLQKNSSRINIASNSLHIEWILL